MNLYCSKCHTCWTEAVFRTFQPCPFTDCDGTLSISPPADLRVKVKYQKSKDLPLLDAAEKA